MEEPTKQCSRCQETKPVKDNFVKGLKNLDGLQRWCNECRDTRRKELACRVEVTEKRCKDCRQVKPTKTEFHRSSIMKDGYQARCIQCHKSRYGVCTDEWNQRRRNTREQNRIPHMLGAAKVRAKEQGIAFDLEEFDITVPDVCPVLGIPIYFTSGKKTPNTPSIDRIHPHLGYTPSNVRIISWRANRLKQDETDPEVFELLALDLKRHQLVENTGE